MNTILYIIIMGPYCTDIIISIYTVLYLLYGAYLKAETLGTTNIQPICEHKIAHHTYLCPVIVLNWYNKKEEPMLLCVL